MNPKIDAAVATIVNEAFEAGKRFADDARIGAVKRTLLCVGLNCRQIYVWFDGPGLSSACCPACGSREFATKDAPYAEAKR